MSARLAAALATATRALLDERNADGHWRGELSASALSTATAITALATVDRTAHAAVISAGLDWLAAHQNADGGWGDTTLSRSNISTTALCWAALSFSPEKMRASSERAELWLKNAAGSLEPDALVAAIAGRYGRDRTFSVPILMMLALTGRLGPGGWRRVMPLPFELAALPHGFYGALRLPVVSYALPALIAIGQAIHHHAPTWFWPWRLVRAVLRGPTLRRLIRLQPENGGFLEATPLTSFVSMALAAAGNGNHLVVQRGVGFLLRSQRPDGSWPIDTDLATWATTLAIKAFAPQTDTAAPPLRAEERLALREWLLAQQHRRVHPYTAAAPGGWAWTDLPGGVPDADDTPGALLALLALGTVDGPTRCAGLAGVRWLLDLQNRDGGIPTFCRGWGALPFDRSSPDLTAHTLRAWSAWLPQMGERQKRTVSAAIARGLKFLEKTQRPDGSWLPLWFGNEHAPDDENPLYGTAHVAVALRELRLRGFPSSAEPAALRWLATAQNADHGWGGVRGAPSTVEETALAVEALAGSAEVAATDSGAAWLVARIEANTWREAAPIGFYFAKLWYHERLYPQVWTVAALGRVAALQPSEQERF